MTGMNLTTFRGKANKVLWFGNGQAKCHKQPFYMLNISLAFLDDENFYENTGGDCDSAQHVAIAFYILGKPLKKHLTFEINCI